MKLTAHSNDFQDVAIVVNIDADRHQVDISQMLVFVRFAVLAEEYALR